jgi:hypothetical protein
VAKGPSSGFAMRFGHVVDVDGQPVWKPSRHTELP